MVSVVLLLEEDRSEAAWVVVIPEGSVDVKVERAGGCGESEPGKCGNFVAE